MPFAIPLGIKNIAIPLITKIVGFAKDKLLGIKTSAQNSPLMYVMPIIAIVLIAIIVIPNMDSIKEKLGIETTKSLSVKLVQEEHNTDIAIQANKNLLESQGVITELKNAEDEITGQLTEEIRVANDTASNIKDKANTKISKIVKDTKISDQQKPEEISKVNIASIWESYCSFNQDSECKQAA